MLLFIRDTAIVLDSALRYLFHRVIKGHSAARAVKASNDGIDRLIQ